MKLSQLNDSVKALANSTDVAFSTDQETADGQVPDLTQRRSGNQKAAPTKPRHKEFFGVPDAGFKTSAVKSTDDGLLDAGPTMKTERPVPNQAGEAPIPPSRVRRKPRKY